MYRNDNVFRSAVHVDRLRGLYRHALAEQIVRNDKRSAYECFEQLTEKLGPPIEGYPGWHPLFYWNFYHVNCEDKRLGRVMDFPFLVVAPFRSGIVGICRNLNDCINYLEKFRREVGDGPLLPCFRLEASELDLQPVNKESAIVKIQLYWDLDLMADGTIPPSLAVPLMLKKMLNNWSFGIPSSDDLANNNDLRLGLPHGPIASLFVSRDTGYKLKFFADRLRDCNVH